MRAEHKVFTWEGETERIDRVLTVLGAARSRHEAQEMILAGEVLLDQRTINKTSQKINSKATIAVKKIDRDFGRGAKKLRAALAEFKVSARDKYALDVGASTGGFTQVLLESGAAKVVALDVGHGQLVSELRADPRVVVVEGFNARNLDSESLKELTGESSLVDLIVADVSFISLTQLFGAFKKVLNADAELVLLQKPQFEVGRENIGHGVVTDPLLHEASLMRVIEEAEKHGFEVKAITPSPILGQSGNREFLMHMVNKQTRNARQWSERVFELVRQTEAE